MNERLSSGNERLDSVLGGGLLKNAINLIIGVPGSGKTILSQQYVFHSASAESPALFLSTVTEPLDKILRYGESLEFFDRDAIRDRRVIYEDLGTTLGERGLGDTVALIDRLLKELRPGLVVIDSFKAFHAFAEHESDFRLFLHGLSRRFTAAALTSIWSAPYTREQAQEVAEFAVADAAISLDVKHRDGRDMRVLQVLKLRGSGFLSGEHAYRISAGGLDVFPRLADRLDTSMYELDTKRIASGIPALDEVLGEGLPGGCLHPDRRTFGRWQDTHGLAFHLPWRSER